MRKKKKRKKRRESHRDSIVDRALSGSAQVSKMRIKTRLSGIRGRIFRCRLGNWFGTEMRRYDGDWESGVGAQATAILEY